MSLVSCPEGFVKCPLHERVVYVYAFTLQVYLECVFTPWNVYGACVHTLLLLFRALTSIQCETSFG